MKFLTTPLVYIAAAVVAVMAFGATSHAAGMAHAADGSLLDLLAPIYQAFAGRDYWYAGSMTIVVAVALVKRYLGDRYAWLHSDEGGAVMAFLGATAGSVAAALGGGAGMTWSIASTAATIGVTAIGGYVAVKHLLIVRLTPLVAKLPAWAQSLARSILWVFDGSPAVQPAPAASGNTPPDAHV